MRNNLSSKIRVSIMKFLEKSKAARRRTEVFLQKDRRSDKVCEAGMRMFVMIYCGKYSRKDLNGLRSFKYIKVTPSSRNIKPQSLYPVEWAPISYAYWVYFLLQEWNTLMESTLNPKDWRCRLIDALLALVMMDEGPTLDELLKIIETAK